MRRAAAMPNRRRTSVTAFQSSHRACFPSRSAAAAFYPGLTPSAYSGLTPTDDNETTHSRQPWRFSPGRFLPRRVDLKLKIALVTHARRRRNRRVVRSSRTTARATAARTPRRSNKCRTRRPRHGRGSAEPGRHRPEVELEAQPVFAQPGDHGVGRPDRRHGEGHRDRLRRRVDADRQGSDPRRASSPRRWRDRRSGRGDRRHRKLGSDGDHHRHKGPSGPTGAPAAQVLRAPQVVPVPQAQPARSTPTAP